MRLIYKETFRRVLLSTFIVLFSMVSFSATYYVSNTGSDSNSGLSSSQPWKSLTKVNAGFYAAGDKILFNSGETFYGTLTVKNSGISGNPITYGAYGTGNKPILSGFSLISGWVSEGNGIYSKIISSADNVTNIVLVDGVNTARGRYPNTGWLTYESHTNNTSITDSQLTGTPNWTGAEAVIRKNKWMLDRNKITNHSGNTLTYATPTIWMPVSSYGYFLQNDIKTLDLPGEWYYNGTKIFMYFGSVVPSSKTVKISTTNMLLVMSWKNNITVENICFEGANSHAIQNTSGQNVVIQNCSFLNIGMTGIFTDANSSNATLTIDGNTFNISNNNAIHMRGANTRVLIKNNAISNIGLIPGSASSVAAGYSNIYDAINVEGANSIIEYNKISNVGHSAIALRTNTGIITRYNYITNFGLTRYDAGGIYSWTVLDGGNRIIHNNIVIGSNKASEGINGSSNLSLFGIYLDEDTQNCKVYNNTVSEVKDIGIFYFNSKTGTIRNNVSYNNGIQFEMSYQFSFGYNVTGMNVKKNIFVSKTSTQPVVVNINDTSPVNQFGVADSNYYARPMDDNLTTQTGNGGAFTGRTLSAWKTFTGQDTHSQKSPQTISNVNDLLFEYNATKTARVVALSSPMIDMRGTKFSGSITLQPYTSVVLMKDFAAPVVYANVPGAPYSIYAIAGNTNASVSFAAPASIGGSAITGYTVTSIPAGGTDLNAGTTSLTHTISGLTNGTSYYFTVKAANSSGTSVSSVFSNAVIPKAPVANTTTNTFTFTGPSSGNVGSTSSNFTVTPSKLFTGNITITFNGQGSNGLGSKVLTFSNSSTPQTFTITPYYAGSINLSPTSNGALINPASLTYNANPVVPGAPTSVVATAGSASATVTFAASTSNGGANITGYTVTSIPAGGTDLNAGSLLRTHTMSGLTNGTSYTFIVKAINSVGISLASATSNSVFIGSYFKNGNRSKSGQIPIDGDEETLQQTVQIDVFPNPSIGRVTVRFSTQPEDGSRVNIVDMSGRSVASRIITGLSEEFNLDQQAPGVYFVKSIIGSHETTQKLIISR